MEGNNDQNVVSIKKFVKVSSFIKALNLPFTCSCSVVSRARQLNFECGYFYTLKNAHVFFSKNMIYRINIKCQLLNWQCHETFFQKLNTTFVHGFDFAETINFKVQKIQLYPCGMQNEDEFCLSLLCDFMRYDRQEQPERVTLYFCIKLRILGYPLDFRTIDL